MSNSVVRYFEINKIMVIVVAYLFFSAILKAITGIDICIPCIWKSIFGFHCPGCGLTTAFISMIKCDFKTAIQTNWMIFVIVPLGIYYVIRDYRKFRRKYNT
jgi:hypothetical protein